MQQNKSQLTPLMQQYWEIKNAHPDKILFFRMGDFFELFYDDAVTAAPILDIVLTSRNKKSEDETPMCGVPHHSIAGHINRLLSRGYKVAICDQLEDPQQSKGIVKRGVTRILSPGMVYDSDTLEGQTPHYLCSFDAATISFLEPTTGECFYFSTSVESKQSDLLSLLNPSELVLTEAQKKTKIENQRELSRVCLSVHEELFENTNLPESARRLISYAVYMQGSDILKTLQEFVERPLSSRLQLSPTVLSHLEVFETYRGEKEGSLFHAIDRTKTSAGARLLKQYLMLPLVQKEAIEMRQRRIQSWKVHHKELKELRESLATMGDIERRLGKISNPNCGPRDLLALSQSLETGLRAQNLVSCIEGEDEDLTEPLQAAVALTQKIRNALVEDPPVSKKEGGLFRLGFSPQLDKLIEVSTNSQKMLLDLEEKEKSETQISSLKIRYNNVFGFYIEVTHTHKNKVPAHYMRKQTLVNAERYVTEELQELEKLVLSAKTKREQLELEYFEGLRTEVLEQTHKLTILMRHWADIDVISAFAALAIERKYSCPVLGGSFIELKASRHPVVEQLIKSFVPNDLVLREGQVLLLTGPNMAGKSTIMRQVALTVILAQVGAFVPAESAKLPIYENLQTRIGATDILKEGLSTFMVEMTETASILKSVVPKTLIVMDEIGRGTSTYDGMSLAQAILEYLAKQNKATVFFATHYHELTKLDQSFQNILNAHMTIREQKGELHFLHTLAHGPASKSYGIEVAKRAGLPTEVVSRARHILADKESQKQNQLNLFDTLEPIQEERQGESFDSEVIKKWTELGEYLEDLDPNELTPIQALTKLAELKDSVLR